MTGLLDYGDVTQDGVALIGSQVKWWSLKVIKETYPFSKLEKGRAVLTHRPNEHLSRDPTSIGAPLGGSFSGNTMVRALCCKCP